MASQGYATVCTCLGLQEQFWTSLYPEIEDGDLETRVLLLEWVNNNLPCPSEQSP